MDVINKVIQNNDYYMKDYKVITDFLIKRFVVTDNDILKNEIEHLKEELINKKISDIDILNRFYSIYMKNKIKFDELKSYEEKKEHMEAGQLIFCVDEIIKGNIDFNLIEIDKNITQVENIYCFQNIKLFEDFKVDNEGLYYYACDNQIALDINSIQKIFSNEIVNLDYLSAGFYNNNKIFLFAEEQDDKYNFQVDTGKYEIYKRVFYIDVGFREIFYIKENEIDINCKLDNLISTNNKFKIYDFMKNSLLELKKQVPEVEEFKEKLKEFKQLDLTFEQHLKTLQDTETEFFNDYVLVKNHEGTHKIYLDNSYDRYFHATSIESAKNIIVDGFITDGDILNFDYCKIFFSPNIQEVKSYGNFGGLDTDTVASNVYIIFECNLDNCEGQLYHYIHSVEHFIYSNKNISPSVIKRIWLVENDVMQKEITKDELLEM